uniref:Uncharacterized protein n=1 Tax=Rhodopseudomonas palustris (strain DX-1) TaxID=652103 RepID=E6VFL2_RHOPX
MADAAAIRTVAQAMAPQKSEGRFGLLDTWPARLAKEIYAAITLPGDVYQGKASMWGEDGRTSLEAINRSADLAGTVMGSTFGAPAGALGAGFVRRTRGATPYNDVGHMMFVADKKLNDIEHYGNNLWHFDTESVPVGQLMHADSPDFRRGLYRALRSDYGRAEARALVDEANPQRIVDSAGLWDNLDLTAKAWNDFLNSKNIRAVQTADGAIVFDPSLVRKVAE